MRIQYHGYHNGQQIDTIWSSWHGVTPMHMALAEEGLRPAGLGSGMRFLDVAAGSGR